jgi:hypothetical protein
MQGQVPSGRAFGLNDFSIRQHLGGKRVLDVGSLAVSAIWPLLGWLSVRPSSELSLSLYY